MLNITVITIHMKQKLLQKLKTSACAKAEMRVTQAASLYLKF